MTHLANSDTTVSLISEMVVLSRMLVQGSDDQGTVVTSHHRLGGPGVERRPGVRAAERGDAAGAAGQARQLRITPEGKASVLESPTELGSDLQSMVSSMPATLPRQRVQIGDSWIQVMTIPVPGENRREGRRHHHLPSRLAQAQRRRGLHLDARQHGARLDRGATAAGHPPHLHRQHHRRPADGPPAWLVDRLQVHRSRCTPR